VTRNASGRAPTNASKLTERRSACSLVRSSTKMARSGEPAPGRTPFWAAIIAATSQVHHESTRSESSVLRHRRKHPYHAVGTARGETGGDVPQRPGSRSLYHHRRGD